MEIDRSVSRMNLPRNLFAMTSKCPFCNSTTRPDAISCPSCGESASTPATDLEREIRSLVEQGSKLEAVKVCRDRTGLSLLEAKQAVDDLAAGSLTPQPKQADDALEADVLSLLRQGEKLHAVKIYRDQMGASLRESKRAVESMAERHGVEAIDPGNSALAILILGAVGVAVLTGVAWTLLNH